MMAMENWSTDVTWHMCVPILYVPDNPDRNYICIGELASKIFE